MHPNVCSYQLALYASQSRPDVCSCWQLLFEAQRTADRLAVYIERVQPRAWERS